MGLLICGLGCEALALDILPSRDEPLHPLAVRNFSGIDVALRVDGDHVKSHKLAAVLAHGAHLAHDCAFVAIKEPNVIVREIGNKQKPLHLVGRKSHTARGTALARGWRQNEFLYELALL